MKSPKERIIPQSELEPQRQSWQFEFAEAISSIPKLLELLEIESEKTSSLAKHSQDFRVRVPHAFIAKMEKGNLKDPLLLQVLASEDEQHPQPGYTIDPVGDRASMAVPGLLHKYRGRVLMITTAACAVHCRYCFRRNFPYQDSQATERYWPEIFQYIRDRRDITEVILSGGDPLSLSDRKIRSLISEIEKIHHVQRLRIHTRLPLVIPSRINAAFVQAVTATRLQCVVVLHTNHGNELDEATCQAIAQLHGAGVTLLNQAVLLRNINDTVAIQIDLAEKLFRCGVLPYYLHLMDKVKGAAHFDIGEHQALTLWDQLRRRLPGYLVPRLAREIPGKPYKTILTL